MNKININGIDYPILGRAWCSYGKRDVKALLARSGAGEMCEAQTIHNDYTGCNYRIDYSIGDTVHCAYIHEEGEMAYVTTAPCPIHALESLCGDDYGKIVGGETDSVDTRPAPLDANAWASNHALADKPGRGDANDEADWDLDEYFEPRTEPQIETWQSVSSVVMRMGEAICRAADIRNAGNGYDTHTTIHDEWVDAPNTVVVLCQCADEALADETLRRVAGQIVGDDVAYDMGEPVTCPKLPDALCRAVNKRYPVSRKIRIKLRLGLASK